MAITATSWRLWFTQGATISLAELTLFDASGTAISKAGATVTANANWGGSETPDKAYDGNDGTWWAGLSSGGTGWLRFDHPAPVTVESFRIRYRNDGGTIPDTLKLQYLVGTEWVDFSGAIPPYASPAPTSNLARTYGHDRTIWRLRILATGQGANNGLQEMEFRSVAGVSEQPSGGFAFATGEWTTTQGANQAFDGNVATNWGQGGGQPAILGYAFSTVKNVAEVFMRARNTGDAASGPTSFVIERSDNAGLTWDAALTLTSEPVWTSAEQRTYALTSDVTALFPTAWDTNPAYLPITVGIDTSWNVSAAYTPIVAEFNTTWNVAAAYEPISQSFPTTWNIEEAGNVVAAFETSWNVAAALVPVSASFAVQWDIEADTGEITAGFATAWNVDPSYASLDRMIVPDYPVIETWTYQTSVFRSENGNEQRRARVVRPVITQQFTAPSFEDVDFQTTRKVMEIDTAGYYPIPMFQYYDFLAQPAAEGDTRLYFNPARVNLVNDQYVALLADHDEAVLAKVDEIHADGVTLATPLPFDVGTGYCACPVLFSRLSQNGSTDHSPIHAYTDFSFVSSDRQLDFVRPGNTTVLKMLDEYPLIDQYIRNNDEVREAYLGGNVVIDNARANPVTFNNEPTRRSFEIVYLANRELSPAYLDYWRKFFDTVKGGAKPFAVPTFRPDASTVAPVVAGDEVITLAGRDFFDVFTQGGYVGLAFGVQSLALECTRVLSVALVDGDSVCELAAPIVGTGYEVASFVMLMRAGDQIILTHDDVSTVLNFDVQMVRA